MFWNTKKWGDLRHLSSVHRLAPILKATFATQNEEVDCWNNGAKNCRMCAAATTVTLKHLTVHLERHPFYNYALHCLSLRHSRLRHSRNNYACHRHFSLAVHIDFSLTPTVLISLSGVHSCGRDMRWEVHSTLRRQQWVSKVGSL